MFQVSENINGIIMGLEQPRRWGWGGPHWQDQYQGVQVHTHGWERRSHGLAYVLM